MWLVDGNPIRHLKLCLHAGGRLYKFRFPSVCHFLYGPFLLILGISKLISLWGTLGDSPHPAISWVCLFTFLFLALRISVRFPHSIPDKDTPPTQLHPISFSSKVPSSLPTSDFFLLCPKGEWGILIWALQLVELLEFCGLYLRYSVLFWLIYTY